MYSYTIVINYIVFCLHGSSEGGGGGFPPNTCQLPPSLASYIDPPLLLYVKEKGLAKVTLEMQLPR